MQVNTAELLVAAQCEVQRLRHEVDAWKAEHAVLEAEKEALAADKAVVQSEIATLQDRTRALEASLGCGMPFFEPVIRDAPDEDPVHVVRSCDAFVPVYLSNRILIYRQKQ